MPAHAFDVAPRPQALETPERALIRRPAECSASSPTDPGIDECLYGLPQAEGVLRG
jgi:hypothetical protein